MTGDKSRPDRRRRSFPNTRTISRDRDRDRDIIPQDGPCWQRSRTGRSHLGTDSSGRGDQTSPTGREHRRPPAYLNLSPGSVYHDNPARDRVCIRAPPTPVVSAAVSLSFQPQRQHRHQVLDQSQIRGWCRINNMGMRRRYRDRDTDTVPPRSARRPRPRQQPPRSPHQSTPKVHG